MANPNTAKFPTNVAADTDLLVATNSFSTTLTNALDSSETTVTVGSTTGLNVPCVLKFDNEYIKATGKTDEKKEM